VSLDYIRASEAFDRELKLVGVRPAPFLGILVINRLLLVDKGILLPRWDMVLAAVVVWDHEDLLLEFGYVNR
jgi:hypothetical protein